MKKGLLLLMFFFISLNSSYANLSNFDPLNPFGNNQNDNSSSNENFVESSEVKDERQREIDRQAEEKAQMDNFENNGVPYDTQESLDNRAEAAAAKAAQDARNAECDKDGDCLDRSSFKISVNSFTPGIKIVKDDNSSNTINRTLGTIIQKLMVALGVLSVLIMTVGAGYMILYHGQDELLSKGKSIFMSGIIALVVALSSYYLVSILRFILYN